MGSRVLRRSGASVIAAAVVLGAAALVLARADSPCAPRFNAGFDLMVDVEGMSEDEAALQALEASGYLAAHPDADATEVRGLVLQAAATQDGLLRVPIDDELELRLSRSEDGGWLPAGASFCTAHEGGLPLPGEGV